MQQYSGSANSTSPRGVTINLFRSALGAAASRTDWILAGCLRRQLPQHDLAGQIVTHLDRNLLDQRDQSPLPSLLLKLCSAAACSAKLRFPSCKNELIAIPGSPVLLVSPTTPPNASISPPLSINHKRVNH